MLTICMNLEDIMLSEVSQSQKDKYCMFPLMYKVPRVVRFIETENRMVVNRSLGRGEIGSCCLMGIEFQFCKMKSSGELLHNSVSILNIIETYIFKWLGW